MGHHFEAECPECGATVISNNPPEDGSVSFYCDDASCETDFDVTLEDLGEFEEEGED